MKNIKFLLALITVVILSSCEEVIQLDLDDVPAQLVIDAAVVWDTSDNGANQTIVISKTKSYFDINPTPAVSNATVTVRNKNTNALFNFVETTPNSGRYECSNFVPVIDNEYELNVTSDNVLFEATETLIASPTIDSLKIKYTEQQFDDDFPVTDVKFTFKDDVNSENYYLYGVKAANRFIYEYNVISDEFSNGNEMQGVHFEDELPEGTAFDVQFMGISKKYHEYLNVLLPVAQSSGNPFDAAASQRPRGNIVNTSDNSNNPNGFFRLSQLRQINSAADVDDTGKVKNN